MGNPRRFVGSAVLVIGVGLALVACGSSDEPDAVVAGQAPPDTAVAEPGDGHTSDDHAADVQAPALDGCGDGLIATASPLYPAGSDLPSGDRPLATAVAETVRQRVGSEALASGIEDLGEGYEAQASSASGEDAPAETEAGSLAAETGVAVDPAAPDAATATVTVTDGGAVIALLRFAELAPDHWVMASASACADLGER